MPLQSMVSAELYKKQEELLYRHVKAEEEKQHDKEFLKAEGAYFQIGGGKCPRCEEEITLKHIENLFGVHQNSTLFRQEIVKEALRVLYNKNMVWHWKWDGSENEVRVTGVDVLKIVEKMYRTETTHFTSRQYQHCGTGGMEAFGSPPYYGWDSSLFIEQPIGTWSSYENPGLSGQGGNAQVTDRPKKFVKLSSVLAGMEYKMKYIIKYNGNYARWYNSNNATAQNTYRVELRGVRARFIPEFITQ